jgi:hypothetical protein
MGLAQWMRLLDTVDVVRGLAQLTQRFRGPAASGTSGALSSSSAPLGAIEARLAGVLVAALKEAFDRDSTRLELERSQIEAERQRAEELLRAELRRQAGERALGQLRLIAVIAVCAWALSAALSVWLPGMRAAIPRGLLGFGWALALGAMGTAFAGWQRISAWAAETRPGGHVLSGGNVPSVPLEVPAAVAAPWLLIGALALTAASVLTAL